MKKSLAIILALIFVMSLAGTALAAPANPFVDVPAKHWAYDAVAKLAKAGIVDGYGDGTFRGDRTTTRYEMAQVVAKAMARSDKADAELKALIDKLAVEFASELNNLGVRVAKLEEKTRIGWNFESRIRYSDTKLDGEYILPGGLGEGTNKFDWRQRIILSGDVNDNVSYVARLETSHTPTLGGSPVPFLRTSGNVPFGSAGSASIGFSQAQFNVKNFLGAVDCLSIGRLDTRGVTNGLLNGKDGNNDGVKVVKKFGDVTFSGQITDQGANSEVALYNLDFKLADNLKLNVGYQTANLTQNTTWIPITPPVDLKSKSTDIGLQWKIGDFYLTGEYVRSRNTNPMFTPNGATKTAYAVQITNGVSGYFYPTYNIVDPRKAHTDAFALSYRKINMGATPVMSTFGNDTYAGQYYPIDAATKGFFLTYQNVVSQNVVLTVEYQDLKFFLDVIPGSGIKHKIFSTNVQFFF